MKKQKKVKEKKPRLRIVAEILVIVTVIAFISAWLRIDNFSRGYYYRYNASNYLYDVERNSFGKVYTTAVRDMRREASYDDNVKECRALGFYFEQAALENAYRKAGQEEKANAFADKKKEYEGELGTLSTKIKDVEMIIGD